MLSSYASVCWASIVVTAYTEPLLAQRSTHMHHMYRDVLLTLHTLTELVDVLCLVQQPSLSDGVDNHIALCTVSVLQRK